MDDRRVDGHAPRVSTVARVRVALIGDRSETQRILRRETTRRRREHRVRDCTRLRAIAANHTGCSRHCRVGLGELLRHKRSGVPEAVRGPAVHLTVCRVARLRVGLLVLGQAVAPRCDGLRLEGLSTLALADRCPTGRDLAADDGPQVLLDRHLVHGPSRAAAAVHGCYRATVVTNPICARLTDTHKIAWIGACAGITLRCEHCCRRLVWNHHHPPIDRVIQVERGVRAHVGVGATPHAIVAGRRGPRHQRTPGRRLIRCRRESADHKRRLVVDHGRLRAVEQGQAHGQQVVRRRRRDGPTVIVIQDLSGAPSVIDGITQGAVLAQSHAMAPTVAIDGHGDTSIGHGIRHQCCWYRGAREQACNEHTSHLRKRHRSPPGERSDSEFPNGSWFRPGDAPANTLTCPTA